MLKNLVVFISLLIVMEKSLFEGALDVKFHPNKYHVLAVGSVSSESNLRVVFDNTFEEHIVNRVKKEDSMAGLIRRRNVSYAIHNICQVTSGIRTSSMVS